MRRIIDEMHAAESAFVYFQALLHNEEQQQGDSAGLGLARVAAEGDMALDYQEAGEELTITAQTRLVQGKASS